MARELPPALPYCSAADLNPDPLIKGRASLTIEFESYVSRFPPMFLLLAGTVAREPIRLGQL